MSLETYVDKASTRQAATELEAEKDVAKVQSRFKVLINSPEERNQDIMDWFLNVYIARLANDIGLPAAKGLGIAVAKLLDLSIDELATVPTFERSMVWTVASSIIVATASRQATIESGLINDSLINGLDNAEDLDKETKNLTDKEIKEITIDIKKQMRIKKNGK